jgi:hypothetical protein
MSNPPLKLVLQPILDALNRGVSPTWFDLGDAAPGPLVAGDVSPGFAITNAIEQAIGKLNDMELTAEAAQLEQFIMNVDECDGDKAIPLDDLRAWLSSLLDGTVPLATIPSTSTPKRTKKKRRSRQPAKLTGKQLEACQIVGECKGNISKAAKQLGKDPKTVREHYEIGMAKLGKTAIKHETKSLPSDKRGQANIANDDDHR